MSTLVAELSPVESIGVHRYRAVSMMAELAGLMARVPDGEREQCYFDDRLCRVLSDLRAALATMTEPLPEVPGGSPCF